MGIESNATSSPPATSIVVAMFARNPRDLAAAAGRLGPVVREARWIDRQLPVAEETFGVVTEVIDDPALRRA
jgi:hypothetical protein